MNQILVTKKLYITPELKRKKKIYKFYFILSVFLIFVLASFYLYTSYARNKDESLSQEVLASLNVEDDTVADDVLVVYLDADSAAEAGDAGEVNADTHTVTTSDGKTYSAIATINIPSINVNYPVLSETTDELLKVSPCKFWGPNPNEVGNFCVVGHNYRNSKFFSRVPKLEMGADIKITDMSGRTLTYKVYDKYTVDPTDVRCTSQLTNGKKEVTLITCTNDNKQRVIVKARCI